jgi:hypothetical protein
MEEDMQRSIALSISLGLFFFAVATASARPAKSSDIAGKTLCWQDGTVEKYTADGKYMNMADGPGTWSIDDKGHVVWRLEKYGVTFSGDEKMNDDGTVTYTGSAPGTDQFTISGERLIPEAPVRSTCCRWRV